MKSDRGREISYEQNLERNNTNELTNRNRLTDTENKLMVTRWDGIYWEIGSHMLVI